MADYVPSKQTKDPKKASGEIGETMPQVIQTDAVMNMEYIAMSQSIGTVILVKAASSTETVPFVDQGITSDPAKITASTREIKQISPDLGLLPSRPGQSVGEASKSASAVDEVADTTRRRRGVARLDTTEIGCTGQELKTARTDSDLEKFHKNTLVAAAKVQVSEKRPMTLLTSDTESSFPSIRSQTPDFIISARYSRQSTPSQTPDSTISGRSISPFPEYTPSSRSQTPNSNISSRSVSARSSNRSLAPFSDYRLPSRSQTSAISVRSLSAESPNEPSSQLAHSRYFIRNQTPSSVISARPTSARPTSGLLPELSDYRYSSRTQTPESIISALSLPSRSTEFANRSQSQTPDSNRQTFESMEKDPSIPAADLTDDSDCIVGPFPIFAPVLHTEVLTETSSSSSSLGSNDTLTTIAIQPRTDPHPHVDYSGDSDGIVGPFPLFSPVRPTAASSASSSMPSHSDSEPFAYSNDDSDQLLSRSSIASLEGSVHCSDDSDDCIVGPFPIFSPVAPKKPSQSNSSLSDETETELSDTSEYLCNPKSTLATPPKRCVAESNDTINSEGRPKGRLRRSFGSFRKGLRRFGCGIRDLATHCFPVAKKR